MDRYTPEVLRQQTTAELEKLLQFCLQDENYADHESTIKEILKILYQRYEPPKGPLPEHIQAAWEKFKKVSQ